MRDVGLSCVISKECNVDYDGPVDVYFLSHKLGLDYDYMGIMRSSNMTSALTNKCRSFTKQ